MLIDKVGKIKSDKQDIAAEIFGLEQSFDGVSQCELKKFISAIQKFKDAVAKAADTLPKIEYDDGLTAMCVPFKSNYGITASNYSFRYRTYDRERMGRLSQAITMPFPLISSTWRMRLRAPLRHIVFFDLTFPQRAMKSVN